MNQNTKPINELSIEELERLELQLWRAKDQYETNLKAVINDLNVITSFLSERKKSNEQPTSENYDG